MNTKILFVEPPKDYWFLMGEHLPPPTVLLVLAAYIERELPDVDVEVVDCQGERKDWKDIERTIESSAPQIVAASGFTCNAYVCARVAETAKRVNPDIVTVIGGQHFSSTPERSLLDFPEIDYIVRGEGEVTFVELLRALQNGDVSKVAGLSFRNNGGVVHTPDRELIQNLDTLPFPAYHLVEDNMKEYHFAIMAGKNKRYLILEGSRGCNHRCSFCTQWRHWGGIWRTKSPKRIADEMEHNHRRFGGQFLWLTDDNFDYRTRGMDLWRELRRRDFADDVSWFFQARTDDIVGHPDIVAKLREVGNTWILVGVESHSSEVLRGFKKGLSVEDASRAVKILNDNDIFTQSMLVLGSRRDTMESISQLRRFSLELDTHLAIYSVLTPFPGTDVYETATKNGWIEDTNWAHYDMVHAIMPTETLSVHEVQEELYRCYRSFYGPMSRNLAGLFSRNRMKRRAYRHMAGKRVLNSLRRLI